MAGQPSTIYTSNLLRYLHNHRYQNQGSRYEFENNDKNFLIFSELIRFLLDTQRSTYAFHFICNQLYSYLQGQTLYEQKDCFKSCTRSLAQSENVCMYKYILQSKVLSEKLGCVFSIKYLVTQGRGIKSIKKFAT